MDRKILKYAFITGVAIGIVAAAIIWNRHNEGKEVMGPEETLETFCRAVAAGQWQEAMALCDTVGMKEYLDSHRKTWKILQSKDSSALAIASGILAGTEISVSEVRKEGDRRVITYTLTAEGCSKTKEATVKKEEGAWRVERITDAN